VSFQFLNFGFLNTDLNLYAEILLLTIALVEINKMAKSYEMNVHLDSLSEGMFGRSRSDSIINATCVICGGDASSFRDALSSKEFTISGMCQACQDSVFGVEEEDC